MELRSLIEYRCACGKLLFKGLMLVSVVEIKCKRCGETRTFRDNMQGIRSFMLIVDGGGRVVDACEGVAVLECSRQYVIGKPLLDILPLARDARYQEIIKSEPVRGEHYQIQNNTLLLRDRKLPIESHIIPINNKGKPLYHVFNIIKEV